MELLNTDQQIQQRLCGQLSAITALSESLIDRILVLEQQLLQMENRLTSGEQKQASDWDGAFDLLASTDERLAIIEQRLQGGVLSGEADQGMAPEVLVTPEQDFRVVAADLDEMEALDEASLESELIDASEQVDCETMDDDPFPQDVEQTFAEEEPQLFQEEQPELLEEFDAA